MRKSAIAIMSVLAAAYAAFADTPVFFCSEGPDRYADGSVVQDGEVYALVWSRTNAVGQVVSRFAIDAKGEVCEPENHAILLCAAIARNGGCPPNVYLMSGGQTALSSSGAFFVYLLDTRVKADEDSEPVVTGLGGADGFCCNSYEQVAAKISLGVGATVPRTKSASGEDVGGATGAGAVATADPADAPAPLITDYVRAADGTSLVEVGDTRPYLQYAILAYETLNSAPVNLANGVNGKFDEPIVLKSSEDKYRFFRVVRSPIRRRGDDEEGGGQ